MRAHRGVLVVVMELIEQERKVNTYSSSSFSGANSRSWGVLFSYLKSVDALAIIIEAISQVHYFNFYFNNLVIESAEE